MAATYGRLAGPDVRQASKSAPRNAEFELTIHSQAARIRQRLLVRDFKSVVGST